MRVLITRPEDDARALAKTLGARGVDSMIASVISIQNKKDAAEQVADLAGVQALVFTSANGVRAFAQAADRRDINVIAVGQVTAKAAWDEGFRDIETADGDVTALAQLVWREHKPEKGALLHVAGSHVAGDLKGLLEQAGFIYRRAVLYEAVVARSLSADAAAAFLGGDIDGVLFYSPRTADLFAQLAKAGGIAGGLGSAVAYCLSAAVAEAAKKVAWKDVRVAARADEASLLALLEEDAVA